MVGWFVALVILGFLAVARVQIHRTRRCLALTILRQHGREVPAATLVSGTRGVLPPGAVYVILDTLEQDGLVRRRNVNGRHYFTAIAPDPEVER